MKTCSKCGIPKDEDEFQKDVGTQDGLCGQCKVCRKEYKRQYYQNNKVKLLIITKRYYQENKKKLVIYGRQYHQEHRSKLAAQMRQYYQDNRKELLVQAKEYRQTPKGKEVSRIHGNKRRAQKNNAEYEKFSHLEIFKRDNWRCQICHKKVRPDFNSFHKSYPNLDHIISLSNGGSHIRKNVQLLCRGCNLAKKANDAGQQLRLFDT